MEIRSINQLRQSTSELNPSTAASTASTQTKEHETSTVNVKLEGSQQNLTNKDVEKAVDKLNKLLEDKETHAEYEVYGKFKDLTIKIVDNKTNEVVQELPPKKIIDMVNKLCELAGVFVNKKA